MVTLTQLGTRDGKLEGRVGSFYFEARLARGPVSYGIDPCTLYKGPGRVARFVLYEVLSRTGARRKVAAFDRGWLFGRKEHLNVIERVVRYLER